MFIEICVVVILTFSSASAISQKSSHPDIKFGKFSEFGKLLEYDLYIKKDSSFRYVERYEWPVEFTEGTWKIEKKVLILTSISNTFNYDPSKGLRTGQYIMFMNERYKIRRKSLVHIGNPDMRLRFRGNQD